MVFVCSMPDRTTKNVLTLPLPESGDGLSESSAALNVSGMISVDVLKDVVDNALQGIVIHRMGEPLYVNRAWAELHGYSVKEVMSMPNARPLIHHTDSERLRRYEADRVKGRHAPNRYRYRGVHRSGKPIWLEVFVRVIQWQGEQVVQCTVIDVDAQEKSAEDLRQSHLSMQQQVQQGTVALERSNRVIQLYASMINQVSERISVIDTDYRYRLTNQANLDFRRRPLSHFVGCHLRDIIGDGWFDGSAKATLDRCFAGESLRTERMIEGPKGEQRFICVTTEPFREDDGTISGAIASVRDITEAHRLSEQLAYQASHDELTGLVNRRAFEQHLASTIKGLADNSCSAALCYIDLDQFKIINDTAGHLVGDRLLQQVAKLLSGKVRKSDVLARLGGDEFGLLLRGCSLRRARRVAENLVAALNDHRFVDEGQRFEVGASIGVTGINRHARCLSDIMSQADMACYAAKDHGRNRVHIYQKEDEFLCKRQEEMLQAGGIRAALDDGRFSLFAQPIAPIEACNSASNRAEILLRMLNENGELIMPSAFIPAAERYGLMAKVDRWVIKNTIGELARKSKISSDVQININLSGVTLSDETLPDFVGQLLMDSVIAPSHLCFEVTETAAIRNLLKTEAFIQELKQLGCRFALDDFGSGLSSLNYLKRLPVDYLKIDQTFVCDIGQDQRSRAMVTAIHQLAHSLGIKTVAEGVADRSTLEILKGLNIDFVQGFAIGRPQPFREVACIRAMT